MMNSGYIAIISTLIIAFLLLTITLAVSSTGFLGRANILRTEFKEIGFALTEGCAETALLKFSQNQSYAGNETVMIGTEQCSILPVETLGNQKIIKVRAVFQDTTSNIKITIDTNSLSVIGWEEVVKF